MNKAIIFDFDGVLVDSKDIHFNALNLALNDVDPQYVISKEDHDSIYEGIPTRTKLELLSKTVGLPRDSHDSIWKAKQAYSTMMFLNTGKDMDLVLMINAIKKAGIKVAVASNSIKETLTTCLSDLGILSMIDCVLSNEDVSNPKPSPEIYVKAMSDLGTDTAHSVIFEDSKVGQEAAIASGAKLVVVKDGRDLTFSRIFEEISYLRGTN